MSGEIMPLNMHSTFVLLEDSGTATPIGVSDRKHLLPG
jgi:hypothetical protein